MSTKTALPTHRRLAEARRNGELPSGRRWISGFSTVAAMGAFFASVPTSLDPLRRWTEALLSNPELPVWIALGQGADVLVRLAARTMLAAFAASFVSSAALVGFRFVPSLALPKADRVSPAQGLRRIFGLQALRRGASGLAAGATIAIVAWTSWRSVFGQLVRSTTLTGEAAGALAMDAVADVATRCAAALFALALGDLALAHWRHRRSLMMTREEVKREHRDSEGDPHHKQQRRAAHLQLVQGGPARGIRAATAVVVNPTHVAVALRYDASECPAPYLVAKGQEAAALALRADAVRLGVPVVANIPLARTLVRLQVGAAIPEELYRATATVLAAVAPAKPHPPALWS